MSGPFRLFLGFWFLFSCFLGFRLFLDLMSETLLASDETHFTFSIIVAVILGTAFFLIPVGVRKLFGRSGQA